MSNLLNKYTENSIKRKKWFEILSYVLMFVGIFVLIWGILTKISIIINFGTLFIGVGIILLGIAHFLHKWTFRK